MGISTRNLEALPDVAQFKRLLQSMAMLDAILMPERYYRYYSFNAHWAQGETMGSMSNGSGDELFAVFNSDGAFLKGLDHESEAAAIPSRHFYRDLPPQLERYSREPAFMPDDVSFCVWRLIAEPKWSCSTLDLSVADGSADILSMFDGIPETYRAWANEYYERDVPLEAIARVYQHRKLTDELVTGLNPEQSLELLTSDIVAIGYAA